MDPKSGSCCICGKSTRRCPAKYKGVAANSVVNRITGRRTTTYGFVWRDMSCSRDSTGDCFAWVRDQLNEMGVRLFDERLPEYAPVFQRLFSGEASTWESSLAFERAMQPQLWRDSQWGRSYIRQHSHMVTTEYAVHLLMQTRFQGQPDPLDTDPATAPLMRISWTHHEHCWQCGLVTDAPLMPFNTDRIAIDRLQNFCEDADFLSHLNETLPACPICGHGAQRIDDATLRLPMVIRVSTGFLYSTQHAALRQMANLELPRRVLIRDKWYVLCAVAYGEGSHFVGQFWDVLTSQLHYADGMENNGQFVAVTGSFRVSVRGYLCNDMYYVDEDYLKSL